VDVTLALITDENYGHTNADDSVTPYYKDLLAWVIIASAVRLVPDMGTHAGTGPACFLVDATSSSAALYAIQRC
jgi:hypothetical protein